MLPRTDAPLVGSSPAPGCLWSSASVSHPSGSSSAGAPMVGCGSGPFLG